MRAQKAYVRVKANERNSGGQISASAAWRHSEQAQRALTQALEPGLSRDLAEAFLMKATQNLQESRAAIEQAGKLLKS